MDGFVGRDRELAALDRMLQRVAQGGRGGRPGRALLMRGRRRVGYWTRTNNPEVDIIGADREPVAKKVTMVGSVKWQEQRPFDDHDLVRLMLHRSQVPGADDTTPLVAVSRSGASTAGLLVLGPDELLTAYRQP